MEIETVVNRAGCGLRRSPGLAALRPPVYRGQQAAFPRRRPRIRVDQQNDQRSDWPQWPACLFIRLTVARRRRLTCANPGWAGTRAPSSRARSPRWLWGALPPAMGYVAPQHDAAARDKART